MLMSLDPWKFTARCQHSLHKTAEENALNEVGTRLAGVLLMLHFEELDIGVLRCGGAESCLIHGCGHVQKSWCWWCIDG